MGWWEVRGGGRGKVTNLSLSASLGVVVRRGCGEEGGSDTFVHVGLVWRGRGKKKEGVRGTRGGRGEVTDLLFSALQGGGKRRMGGGK